MKNKNFELKKRRYNTKIMTDDVIAIRKMRIFRKISREAAAQTVNISPKTLERFEHGRTTFPEERKKALIRRYRFTLQEYSDILEGKIVLPDLPARSVFNKPQKTEQERRKYQKIITKRVRVIRSMRKMKG
ncbi:MAG: helix-turn-helix transcriptional regulator, partial [Bacteriovoracaceae bacterium]|nr:helix-turn-helix transcriptional regulator [Bacteriovoracaceae bacterium]